jgi:molecular chaperone GrpE
MEANADDVAQARAENPEARAEAQGQPQPEEARPAPGDAAAPAPGAADGTKAEEYLQALQRERADFANYKRRVAAEQSGWGERAVAGFVLGLLPVLDNLERALGAAADAAAVRQGVELTVRQLREILQTAGVAPMEAAGQPFDPARHEAVARGPAPGVPEGVVAEEYRRGYLYRDQVLRPAMVRVSDGSAGAADPAAVKEGER